MSTSSSHSLNALQPFAAFLEPLVRSIVGQAVEEVLAQLEVDEARLGSDRLWYSEAEASAMLGLPSHRLRDCRRRGEITGSKIGKAIGYERSELLRFLRDQRVTP
jgi:hypothetical protein